jgi:uncharacterized membrane protein YqjE
LSAGPTAKPTADAGTGPGPDATAASGTDAAEPASLEEQIRAIERDVRELVRLHGELARLEARTGLLRLVVGIFMLGVGIFVAGFVLLAAGFASYLSLLRVMPPAAAAAVVAGGFAIASLGAWLVAWRLLQGAGSLFLPRTRAMLQEIVRWKNKPTGS